MTLPPLLAVSGSHCWLRVVASSIRSSLFDLSSSGEKTLNVCGYEYNGSAFQYPEQADSMIRHLRSG